ASSSASRISRIATATSSSDSRPRERRSVRVAFSRSERESNIETKGSASPRPAAPAAVLTPVASDPRIARVEPPRPPIYDDLMAGYRVPYRLGAITTEPVADLEARLRELGARISVADDGSLRAEGAAMPEPGARLDTRRLPDPFFARPGDLTASELAM